MGKILHRIGLMLLGVGAFGIVGCVWLLLFAGGGEMTNPGSPVPTIWRGLAWPLAIGGSLLVAAGGGLWILGIDMSRSPVSRAAAKGDLSALESAVRETPEAIEKPDASGQTPLIIAAIRGHAAIVQALLRAGADPNKPSSGEFAITALYEAARGGHVPVIDALLGSGAQVVVGRFDALQNAISASKEDAAIPLVGYIDDVNQAINFSLGVDQPYVSEGTYLMFAAWKGLTGVVESLLQAGADPGLTSAAGRTALDYASGNDGARALLRAALKDIPDTRDSGTAEHFT